MKSKIFIVGLSLGLVMATPFGEIIKNDNVVSARYDGWASSNWTDASYYITNSELKDTSPDYLNVMLTSAIGYMMPGGAVTTILGGGLGVVFTNSYYQTQRITAISQGKGLLVRLRFSYTKDNWGNTIPSLVNYYYSVQ